MIILIREAAVKLYEGSLQAIGSLKDSSFFDDIEKIVDTLTECFKGGGKVLVFGNGGSAADSQHICGELVGKFNMARPPLSAIALTTDTSVITAWGNDCDFETVFLRQLEAHGRPGDVAWGISTSGNSPNVLRALDLARKMGIKTIGLLGNGGGKCLALCDCAVAVEEKRTSRIQEAHVIAYHIICALVEKRLFADD
ncbi:MAG: D-sedoheptulose-7-phosphate isomerase [Desulfocucumaceae bacterium]